VFRNAARCPHALPAHRCHCRHERV
jgi:hypothetical protein